VCNGRCSDDYCFAVESARAVTASGLFCTFCLCLEERKHEASGSGCLFVDAADNLPQVRPIAIIPAEPSHPLLRFAGLPKSSMLLLLLLLLLLKPLSYSISTTCIDCPTRAAFWSDSWTIAGFPTIWNVISLRLHGEQSASAVIVGP
jgi:hypothetical protein